MKLKLVLFSLLGLVIIVLVLGRVFSFPRPVDRQASPETQESTPYNSTDLSQKCSGERTAFANDITDLKIVAGIVPPGATGSGANLIGTEYKTHSYIRVNSSTPVYAPLPMTLIEGAYYTEEGNNQYQLIFEAECLRVFLDHILEPVDSIRGSFSSTPLVNIDTLKESQSQTPGLVAVAANPRVQVKAGELLGYTTGTKLAHRFDFGVYNFGKKSPLADQAQYQGQWRYEFADCPYDYYPDDKKQAYYAFFESINSQQSIPETFCKQKEG